MSHRFSCVLFWFGPWQQDRSVAKQPWHCWVPTVEVSAHLHITEKSIATHALHCTRLCERPWVQREIKTLLCFSEVFRQDTPSFQRKTWSVVRPTSNIDWTARSSKRKRKKEKKMPVECNDCCFGRKNDCAYLFRAVKFVPITLYTSVLCVWHLIHLQIHGSVGQIYFPGPILPNLHCAGCDLLHETTPLCIWQVSLIKANTLLTACLGVTAIFSCEMGWGCLLKLQLVQLWLMFPDTTTTRVTYTMTN